eukprot:12884455-Prorocentrum_lima.AAC.1
MQFPCGWWRGIIVDRRFTISDGKEDASVAFKSACATPRRCWCSSLFKQQHVELYALLVAITRRSKQKQMARDSLGCLLHTGGPVGVVDGGECPRGRGTLQCCVRGTWC